MSSASSALFASPWMRSIFSGLAGFVAYGGWAYFANLEHGSAIAMRAGLVQGSYSLVLTFFMTLFTEFAFVKIYGLPFAKLLTTGAIAIVLTSTAYFIHLFVGTPEIIMTILPGALIGTTYTFMYIVGLERSMMRNSNQNVKTPS